MDEHLIKSWNSVVSPNDTIYCLGDFSFHRDVNEMRNFFRRLNGKERILILGNHDHQNVRQLDWTEVTNYKLLKYNKQKFILFHYPIKEGQWDAAHHGSILIHSHVHGKPQYGNKKVRAIDVGVDSIGPVPISIDEVQKRMEKIPIEVSHH